MCKGRGTGGIIGTENPHTMARYLFSMKVTVILIGDLKLSVDEEMVQMTHKDESPSHIALDKGAH